MQSEPERRHSCPYLQYTNSKTSKLNAFINTMHGLFHHFNNGRQNITADTTFPIFKVNLTDIYLTLIQNKML